MLIEQMKSDAARAEQRQVEEVNKLKKSLDKVKEELKQHQHEHEKEKTNSQDRFNQVCV